MRSCSITVVGDGNVGKTCFLFRYIEDKPPDLNNYQPTVFENHATTINVHGKEYNVMLLDTAGQEGYERLRTLAYKNTDIFILCYDLSNNISFENCRRWADELREASKKKPIFLVGNKVDLIDKIDLMELTQKGLKMAKVIKAVNFFSTSASTGYGIKEVVYEAVRYYASHRKFKKCVII